MTDRLLTAILTPGAETRRKRWLASSAPIVLLGVAWAIAYRVGGSHTAVPHLFYLPILFAAITMGARGGALAGLVAALLCGPLLPLDVATGEAQTTMNWVTRGTFFVLIGSVTGAGVQAIRRRYDDAIERTLNAELLSPLRVSSDVATSITIGEIRQVLDSRAFHVVFQPIHRLDDGAMIAVEALSRFHGEPYRPPDVWFGRATDAGLGVELELATAESALLAAHAALSDELSLGINVSPGVLLDGRLLALLDRYPRRHVIFEVTEHAIVDDYHELDVALEGLRSKGARLAVDDVGAGFSSLRHIVRLSPDIIKLDLSLTQGLGADPVRSALADCLVDFARRTDTTLVAEGIEHPNDLELWRELGAHAAQGYLLGRPAPLPLTASDQRSA